MVTSDGAAAAEGARRRGGGHEEEEEEGEEEERIKCQKTRAMCRRRRRRARPGRQKKVCWVGGIFACVFPSLFVFVSFAQTSTQGAQQAVLSIEGGIEAENKSQRTARGATSKTADVDDVDVKPAVAAPQRRALGGEEEVDAGTAAQRDTALALSAIVRIACEKKRKKKKRKKREARKGKSSEMQRGVKVAGEQGRGKKNSEKKNSTPTPRRLDHDRRRCCRRQTRNLVLPPLFRNRNNRDARQTPP